MGMSGHGSSLNANWHNRSVYNVKISKCWRLRSVNNWIHDCPATDDVESFTGNRGMQVPGSMAGSLTCLG